ncbi:MAG: hypothetical protein LBS21_13480 [Clostridiales bacterium]|nr:hypothetical protein [Clostridiales bacterium]
MIDFIHIFICIIASVVYIVAALLTGELPDVILMRLVFIMVISYIAGLMLRAYLRRTVFKKEDDKLIEEGAAKEDTVSAASDDDFDSDDF